MSRFRNWKIGREYGGLWFVEWWDGRGCYICSDEIKWWEIPHNVYLIWKEQRV